MRIAKQSIAIMLVLFVIMSMVTPAVQAKEETAAERAATFLDFAADSSTTLTTTNELSAQDYFVLSAYMSNWFQPGQTTLKDVMEPEGSVFYTNFCNALNKDADSSLKSLISEIGQDTAKGLGNGNCIIKDKDNKIVSGFDFLEAMRTSVDTTGTEVKSTKFYFGDNTHLAFDLSVPAFKAAWQTVCAYNPYMFLTSGGIQRATALYIDAVGNIWALIAPEGFDTSIIDSRVKQTGLVTTIGAENFYLVMPACVNPAGFSPDIKSAADIQDVKMPLCNRFVMGSLLGMDSFSSTSGTHTFSDEYVPFHNLLSTDYAGARTNTPGLSVFGVYSLTPYLLRTDSVKDTWQADKRQRALANFAWDSSMLVLDTQASRGKGVGTFGTESYIVFAPNICDVDLLVSSNKVSKNGNTIIDLISDLGHFEWGRGMVYNFTFSVFYDGSITTDPLAEKQKGLLNYLYTATPLTLNQVSMSMYLIDAGFTFRAYGDEVCGTGEDSDEAIAASKMGLKGFGLFTRDEFSPKADIVGVAPDNMEFSKLMQEFIDTTGDITLTEYTALKNEGILPSSLVTDTSTLTDNAYDFIVGKESATATNGVLLSKVGLTETNVQTELKDSKVTVWLKPSGAANVGNKRSDLAFAGTLGVEDSKIRAAIAKENEYLTTVDNINKIKVTYDSVNEGLNFLLTDYAYGIFTPSDMLSIGASDGLTGVADTFSTLMGTEVSNSHSLLKPVAFKGNTSIMMGIYFGYLIDMMGMNTCSADGIGFAEFNPIFLPKYDNSSSDESMKYSSDTTIGTGVTGSEDNTYENMTKDIIRRIYGFTEPTNNEYRGSWLKCLLEDFVLTIHRTITGTWSTRIDTISTGSTSTYQSVTGYIYTPTLEELSFTAPLMNNYLKIYAILMIVMLVILLLSVVVNLKTIREAIIILAVMAFALLFPYLVISNSITISNKISNSIYSEKFDFWALSQHQQKLSSLISDTSLNEKEAILNLANASAEDTTAFDNGVRVKWMAPKKADIFQSLYSDPSLRDSFVTNMEVFKWLFSSLIYDSEFVDTDIYGSYLYRPYNSLANEAQAYYEWGKAVRSKQEGDTISYNAKSTDNYDSGYTFRGISKAFAGNLEILRAKNLDLQYIAGLARVDNSFYRDGDLLVQSEEVLADINKVDQYDIGADAKDIVEANQIGMWGSLADDVTERIISNPREENGTGIVSNLPVVTNGAYFDNKDIKDASKAIFLKNTESPYYYFYAVLKDRYETSGSFNSDILDTNMFKVKADAVNELNTERDINGAYRDFLDIEGLFTYVVPYLKQSNDYVKQWQDIHGSTVADYDFGYELKENGEVDLDKFEGSEKERNAMQAKNEFNQVWNMYSPWVDSLYDVSYVSEKVKVGSKAIYISDTYNPSTYVLNGRPMVFSQADGVIKGYDYKDLTEVEKKIQNVTEKTYEDLLYMVNYIDMDEEVLLSAAAMYATFNFNKEFSQNKILGESITLYPQGFELKNFNYDAFMRLAILNSTGESVFATADLYTRVLNKTSIFTGIMLLVCDFVACVAIPVIKFIIILALVFLGLIMCILLVVNPPEQLVKALFDAVLKPTLQFMLLNISFAFAMSLIIGEGLTSYVGAKAINFATNDPTVTMILMAVLGGAYVTLSWKIVQALFKSYKAYVPATALAAYGLLTGAVVSKVSNIKNAVNDRLALSDYNRAVATGKIQRGQGTAQGTAQGKQASGVTKTGASELEQTINGTTNTVAGRRLAEQESQLAQQINDAAGVPYGTQRLNQGANASSSGVIDSKQVTRQSASTQYGTGYDRAGATAKELDRASSTQGTGRQSMFKEQNTERRTQRTPQVTKTGDKLEAAKVEVKRVREPMKATDRVVKVQPSARYEEQDAKIAQQINTSSKEGSKPEPKKKD